MVGKFWSEEKNSYWAVHIASEKSCKEKRQLRWSTWGSQARNNKPEALNLWEGCREQESEVQRKGTTWQFHLGLLLFKIRKPQDRIIYDVVKGVQKSYFKIDDLWILPHTELSERWPQIWVKSSGWSLPEMSGVALSMGLVSPWYWATFVPFAGVGLRWAHWNPLVIPAYMKC